jgi:transcriptional regulator GlxA family with amidase domain
MNEPTLNRLDILDPEKRKLRANNIKLKEIRHHSLRELRTVLDVSEIRAMELKAMSEIQYLTHLRLKNAYLLKKTKRPVGWICHSCGFEDQSSFIRLFKKEFGKTPQIFRKDHLL